MASVQIDQIRCEATSGQSPEQASIVIAADNPAVILYESNQVFAPGSVFNIGKVFNFNQQIRIHVIAIRPTGNVSYGPAEIFAQAPPSPELLTGLFPAPGIPGRYDLVYRILPQAPPPPPLHHVPSTDQLN